MTTIMIAVNIMTTIMIAINIMIAITIMIAVMITMVSRTNREQLDRYIVDNKNVKVATGGSRVPN